MKAPPGHTALERTRDPFLAFIETLKEAIIAGVVERLISEIQRPTLDLNDLGIAPLRAYSAEEVAEILGTTRTNSIYEIPERDLPRVRRVGRTVGYLGINVLCYMHGLKPVDVAGAVEQFRARLLDERPSSVRPLYPDQQGKTRVL